MIMHGVIEWTAIIGIPIAVVAILIIYNLRFRTDIFVEIGDSITTVSQYKGRVLFRLSNQLIILSSGRKERIIAVGKPGEYGFPSSPSLPPDAKRYELSEVALQNAKRGKKLWKEFLRYCGVSGIKEIRGSDNETSRSLPMSRIFIYSKISDTRINAVLTNAIGNYWFSGSAPKLLKYKQRV